MKLLEWIGVVLLVCGLVAVVAYTAFFDVSVPAPGEDGYMSRRVVNLGRMHERTVGVIVGIAAAVVGGVLLGIGHAGTTRAARPRCPWCQGVIEELAVVCPSCRREQPGFKRDSKGDWRGVKDQVDQWYQDRGEGRG
jgi:drug/metabolite transporter (DMT)-like permease